MLVPARRSAARKHAATSDDYRQVDGGQEKQAHAVPGEQLSAGDLLVREEIGAVRASAE